MRVRGFVVESPRMNHHLSWLALLSSALLACGSSGSTSTADAGGTTDGPTSEAAPGDGSGSSSGGSTTDGGGDGAPSDGSMLGDTGANPDGAIPDCTAPSVSLTFANCPPEPTCGGTIVDGTYFYTAGCLNDPWAQAKMTCPSLQVTNQQGAVKGCVSFTASIVARDVTSNYSATATFPTACLAGSTCTQLQTLLLTYFQKATCTAASGGCSCDVSSTYSSQAAGAFTTSNNQIVTSAGNHYDYCMNGNDMGISYLSGPTPEPGNYTLTKQ